MKKRKAQSPRKLQAAFFKKAGAGIRTLKQMMDTLPMVAFYIKDATGRIMALNPLNCEICNVKSEFEVVGKKSSDLFPPILAEAYMNRDRKVIETRRPLIDEINRKTADRSPTPRSTNTFPIFGPKGAVIGTGCAIYLANEPSKSSSWFSRTRIAPALDYIERHFTDRISIPKLARTVGLSETAFRRQFRDNTGCSPVAYITTLRINLARKLLETTEKRIVEIAAETGFNDHAHFIHAFRKQRKMSPGEYRRLHLP